MPSPALPPPRSRPLASQCTAPSPQHRDARRPPRPWPRRCVLPSRVVAASRRPPSSLVTPPLAPIPAVNARPSRLDLAPSAQICLDVARALPCVRLPKLLTAIGGLDALAVGVGSSVPWAASSPASAPAATTPAAASTIRSCARAGSGMPSSTTRTTQQSLERVVEQRRRIWGVAEASMRISGKRILYDSKGDMGAEKEQFSI